MTKEFGFQKRRIGKRINLEKETDISGLFIIRMCVYWANEESGSVMVKFNTVINGA